MTLALRYAARSDVGLVRSGNEDSGYAGPNLLVVADGMGGHAAGELASAAAVARLAELEQSEPSPDGVLAGLTHSIEQAGMSIGQIVHDNPDLAGMGTTVTALFWQGERVAVVHVGDSRAYLLRDGELGQITHDHTYVQTLVDAGRISAEEAAHHPRRSLLMRAIDGVQPVEADLSVREARVGDRYLLCSDGLTGVVSDEELAAVLSDGEPTGVVITLVELALSRGAPDNVTVVVADVLPGEPSMRAGNAPVVVGAAGEPRVRSQLPQIRFPDDAQPDPNRPEPPSPVSGPPTSEIPLIDAEFEVGAHRSGLSPQGKRTLRIVIAVVAVLALLAGVVSALGAVWWSNQWYVGSDRGQVTIFQGLPGSVGGLPLHRTTEITQTQVSQLPIFDAELIDRGIAADSLEDARRIADEMALRAAECQRPRPPAGCPTVEIEP